MADILTEEDLIKSALYEAVRDKVFNNGMTLTLDSPITDEQWGSNLGCGFDNTERVWFNTKNGKRVEFVKRKRGEWIKDRSGAEYCSKCLKYPYDDGEYYIAGWNSDFCPRCGADMRKGAIR